MCCSVLPGLASQHHADVNTLFRELQDSKTTEKAAGELLETARTDTSTRHHLASHLPGLIQRTSSGPIWLSAVQLAGDLKLAEAVPVLAASLEKDNVGGPTTFTESERLDDDPVGRALVKIGDPSIGPVAQVLATGDTGTRWRAATPLLRARSWIAIFPRRPMRI